MEITLLVKNIYRFFHLSAHKNIKCVPIQRYYRNIEEMLKILKSVLDAMDDAEFTSDELLQEAFAGLVQSVAELLELFDACQLLMSKVYFVLQVESLMVKIKSFALEFFELLKLCDQRALAELSNASVKLYAHKVEHLDIEQTSAIILQAIKDQVDGSGAKSEDLVKIATRLSLDSNHELLIEVVALERLKENAEQSEYFDQMILLVTHMLDRFVLMKQCHNNSPVRIPPDYCCPLSLNLMIDPVIVASGQTYERAYIREWIDLGLLVCPKTRQMLAHTCLIPNYTLKALIKNWCESHNVKLLDPSKVVCSNQLQSRADLSRTQDSNRSLSSGNRRMIDANRSGKCATFAERVDHLEQGLMHLNTQVSYAIKLIQSLHTAQGLPIPPPSQ